MGIRVAAFAIVAGSLLASSATAAPLLTTASETFLGRTIGSP